MKSATKPLIVGISGTELTKEEREFYTKNPVAGFIIFRRNIDYKLAETDKVEALKKLVNLVSELKALCPDAMVLMDQEGGRVQRFAPPFTEKYPNSEYFGNLYDKNSENALKETCESYFKMSSELKKLGIDSPVSPVADLRFKGASDVIGDRSFDSSVEKVVDLCKAAIKGIKEAGLFPMVKHAPGHGRSKVDSHKELPFVDIDTVELEKTDFAIFKALAKDCQNAMVGHLVFKALDPEKPATLSKKVIGLIKSWGFDKIFTDAIEMMALHKGINYNPYSKEPQDPAEYQKFMKSLGAVSQEAIGVGCDYVLHCTGKLPEVEAIYEIL